jgi:diacylglycerol kinase
MKVRKLVNSFKFAIEGIAYCVKSQRNMKIHLCAAIIVSVLGWWQQLPFAKIAILVFAVALVLLAEMFNTAIEAVVDIISPQYNPQAKIAKDVAAGAVLLAALVSLAIGYIVFLT